MELKVTKGENPIAEAILELGSILSGRELTMEEALKNFRNIDPKKVEFYHNPKTRVSYTRNTYDK